MCDTFLSVDDLIQFKSVERDKFEEERSLKWLGQ
jgi:hypothetical protein